MDAFADVFLPGAPGARPPGHGSAAPLAVPVVVYAACVLAAATSLPLPRRSLHRAELRHA